MNPMIKSLEENFSRQGDAPGGELVHQVRQQAMKEFLNVGLPAPRNEYWKYTTLRNIGKRSFGLPQDQTTIAGEIGIAGLNAIRVVFVNGIYQPDRSDDAELAINGLRLLPEALQQEPGLARGLLPQPDPNRHQFVSLNRAFMNQGVVVELGKDQQPARPIYLLFHSSGGEQAMASHPRVLIRAATGSKASVSFMAPKKFTAMVCFTTSLLNPFRDTPAVLTRMSIRDSCSCTWLVNAAMLCESETSKR